MVGLDIHGVAEEQALRHEIVENRLLGLLPGLPPRLPLPRLHGIRRDRQIAIGSGAGLPVADKRLQVEVAMDGRACHRRGRGGTLQQFSARLLDAGGGVGHEPDAVRRTAFGVDDGLVDAPAGQRTVGAELLEDGRVFLSKSGSKLPRLRPCDLPFRDERVRGLAGGRLLRDRASRRQQQ